MTNEPTIATTTDAPREDSCEARIEGAMRSRLADLEAFAFGPRDDDNPDGYDPEEGEPEEYGLSLDFCRAENGRGGFIRYQLSTGGPGDEFRIYADGSIEYAFIDWFDYASRELSATDRATVAAHLMLDEWGSLDAWCVDMLGSDRGYEDGEGWIDWDEVSE